jgi:hypothetical protein
MFCKKLKSSNLLQFDVLSYQRKERNGREREKRRGTFAQERVRGEWMHGQGRGLPIPPPKMRESSAPICRERVEVHQSEEKRSGAVIADPTSPLEK